MKNLGIHHVSALVSDIQLAFPFYHKILGMKLLMKTVNQDDHSMLHLFFSDEKGTPGTEFTVFQIDSFKENRFGTNSIDRVVFLVKSQEALVYWQNRLSDHNVEHCGIEEYGETQIIRFEDSDGMKLGLSYHPELPGTFFPNKQTDIPLDYSILGIHSVHLRVRYIEATKKLLINWFDFQSKQTLYSEQFPITILNNLNSQFKHEIHLIEDYKNIEEDQGIGGIHHVALFAENYQSLLETNEKIIDKNLPNSGLLPREFFDAIYFRDPNNIIFEVASVIKKVSTPISADSIDDIELYLPDFLSDRRESIESRLKELAEYKNEKY